MWKVCYWKGWFFFVCCLDCWDERKYSNNIIIIIIISYIMFVKEVGVYNFRLDINFNVFVVKGKGLKSWNYLVFYKVEFKVVLLGEKREEKDFYVVKVGSFLVEVYVVLLDCCILFIYRSVC